jgi:hypothetical protein
MTQIGTEKDIITVCMYCKQWKDDNGHWYTPDSERRHNTLLSHGICLECIKGVEFLSDLFFNHESNATFPHAE